MSSIKIKDNTFIKVFHERFNNTNQNHKSILNRIFFFSRIAFYQTNSLTLSITNLKT